MLGACSSDGSGSAEISDEDKTLADSYKQQGKGLSHACDQYVVV